MHKAGHIIVHDNGRLPFLIWRSQCKSGTQKETLIRNLTARRVVLSTQTRQLSDKTDSSNFIFEANALLNCPEAKFASSDKYSTMHSRYLGPEATHFTTYCYIIYTECFLSL
jgi:hypothetical protein